MKLILVNQGHTPNIGDEAIQQSIEAVVGRRFEVKFYPFESNLFKGQGALSKWLERIVRHLPPLHDLLVRWRVRGWLMKEGHCDGAIIGGGELLSGSFGPFASDFNAWTRVLSDFNIPIFVIGVSGDHAKSNWISKRYRIALSRCTSIGVRDYSTKELVVNEYGRHDCYQTPDVVFSYGTTHVVPGQEHSSEISHERNTIVCAPPCIAFQGERCGRLGVSDEREYIDYVCAKLNKIIHKSSARRVIFLATAIEDCKISEKICEYFANHTTSSSVSTEYRGYVGLKEYLMIVSEAAVVFSGRMHACILGLISGASFQVIPFKEKLCVFSNEYSDGFDLYETQNEAREALEKLCDEIESIVSL